MPSLAEFMRDVHSNIEVVRNERRASFPVVDTHEEARRRNDGDVFVEELGAVISIEDGLADFFYTPESFVLRDPMLWQMSPARRVLFEQIGAQFRQGSRVLVIGAGGDVEPIQAFRSCGHEVIATDFAQDLVDALQTRIDVPAFACDLADLDLILPESVDYIFGNSTLGYLAPTKFNRIVANIASAIREAAVFTFDQTPHPRYFNIGENVTELTTVNESAANPRTLLSFVENLGVEAGIAAMAMHQNFRGEAVNLAMLTLLIEQLERRGCRTSLGIYELWADGYQILDPILRVARRDRQLLNPVAGEDSFRDARDAFRRERTGTPAFRLVYIDRETGEKLARLFGVHTFRIADPWNVSRYVDEHPPQTRHIEEQRENVLAGLDPVVFAERIRPILNGTPFPRPAPLPLALNFDQVLHKAVLVGEVPFDQREADRRIDMAYTGMTGEEMQAALSATPASRRVQRAPARDDDAKKRERKRQKADRKKQRRR